MPQTSQPSVFQQLNTFVESVPVITRYIVFSTLAFSLGAKVGLIHPKQLILMMPPILEKYEIWRLVTCHLFSGGQGLIWHLYFIYEYSKKLETGHFATRKADYALTLFIMIALMDLIGVYLNYMLLTEAFGMAITYLYANTDPEKIVSFMFGFNFKAVFLPWVLLLWVWFCFDLGFSNGGSIRDSFNWNCGWICWSLP
jgi:derlin-1